ncbi:Membrane protein YdfJ [Clavibacter michiganensis subsp. michiganensis]|uniref:Membrane protein YdfJ n=2 Tax=Clavibacter michiganensis TaxID=28447 RepID=A0A251XI07_CLAMM|nr:Membrane protein YdfJ [Clavibacter michiganensis subsp. michiganensis]OUE01672.1 Membrane protein YdfJ [Clavibacter michiganensis subsp. michiganensis]
MLVDITQTTDPIGVLGKIGDEIRGLDDVAFVGTGTPNPSVDTAIIQVVPDSPPESAETTALMQSIRDLAPGLHDRYDTRVSVTGTTAVQNDISQRLDQALVPFGIVVVGLSILLLMIVFRSIFVPVKAAIGFLLSVVVSFGTVVLIFQQGLFADALGVTPGPILSFMPILLMAILFGLAMDYEVFLVSGMREDFVHHGDAKRAIVTGFSGAARVVTAAALIMFFVFAAFVPEGAGVIKTIALGLAVGIFFDAFLVRMTLVPAAMALLGKRAWWIPRWLDRILPDVDIEGEGLREHQDDVDWAHASGAAVAAERLVVGVPGRRLRPVDLSAPAGSLVLVEGAVADRRLLGATLGARLAPLSGRAHVTGHPLASEAGRVLTSVAMADLGRVDRVDSGVTVGDLLAERIDLSEPMGRRPGARRARPSGSAGSTRRPTRGSPAHRRRRPRGIAPAARARHRPDRRRRRRTRARARARRGGSVPGRRRRARVPRRPARARPREHDRPAGAPWFPDEHGIPAGPPCASASPRTTRRSRSRRRRAPRHRPARHDRQGDPPMTTRSARRRLAVALVAIVPLAVAGLFIGSLSDVAKGVERVPAAIVNQDEIVQQKAADGTESPVLAGRLLVTQLTSDDNQAFDWTITNADEAQRMLDDGEVYAVLTVPKDFSSSIVSLSTDAPKRAEISVKTDDAHGYLTGAATQAVGVGMTSVFGNAITSQFVSGIYTTFGGLKGSLTDAGAGADKLADGATQLSAGATTLGDGITQLGDGVGQSQQGASKLADGLGTYTGGVSQLSSGLDRLQTGAAGLSQVSDGVGQYAGGAGQIAAQVAGLRQQLAANPQSAPIAAQLEPLEQGLDQYAAQGQALATQAAAGIQGVQQGIGQSASGASQLAANGGPSSPAPVS